jgi:hypothetical protein
MDVFFRSVAGAFARARQPILWIGLTYLFGVVVGVVMTHTHSGFALSQGDQTVGEAVASDPAMAASIKGLPVRAALFDFAENLGRGAIPTTVMGLGLIFPFPVAAYRGWIGGIVSVDGEHKSRLRTWQGASYYAGVLLLQLIPYSLAGGAGVRLGLGFLFPKSRWGYKGSNRWLTIPVDGLKDVARVYALVVPLFLIASMVEFLCA